MLPLSKLTALASTTAMDASLLLGMVSACMALVASIVGPIVALNFAKHQFNAMAIVGNRNKWIRDPAGRTRRAHSLLATALFVKWQWEGPLGAGTRSDQLGAGHAGRIRSIRSASTSEPSRLG